MILIFITLTNYLCKRPISLYNTTLLDSDIIRWQKHLIRCWIARKILPRIDDPFFKITKPSFGLLVVISIIFTKGSFYFYSTGYRWDINHISFPTDMDSLAWKYCRLVTQEMHWAGLGYHADYCNCTPLAIPCGYRNRTSCKCKENDPFLYNKLFPWNLPDFGCIIVKQRDKEINAK